MFGTLCKDCRIHWSRGQVRFGEVRPLEGGALLRVADQPLDGPEGRGPVT